MTTLGNEKLPTLPASPTDPQPFIIPLASLADDLSTKYGVSKSDVEDIIRNNPGLTDKEYELLVDLFARTGQKPYNVKGVVGIGTRKKGGPARIIYVTQGDIDHFRASHPADFAGMTDQDIANLLMDTIQKSPDAMSSDGTSTRYEYDNIMVKGKKVTLVINVSDQDPGRIVSSFIK